MPGNDFEKQVQLKMDELKFVPSDTVWPAVEKKITDRKKRRRLFIWLPVLGLFLSGAAWFFIAGTGNTTAKNRIATKPAIAFSKENKTENKTGDNSSSPNAAAPGQAKQPASVKDSNHLAYGPKNKDYATGVQSTARPLRKDAAGKDKDVPLEVDRGASVKKPYLKPIHKEKAIIAVPGKYGKDHFSPQLPALVVKRNNNANRYQIKAVKPTIAEKIDADAAAATTNKEDNQVQKIIDENSGQANDMALPDSIKAAGSVVAISNTKDSIRNKNNNDSAKAIAANKPAGKTKKKIVWGISVNGGMSNISKGFSGLFSANSAYASPSNSPNSSTGSGSSTVTVGPSGIKPGLYYAAGVFISKPVGNNVSVQAGLNYAYYSNHIEVGNKINSSSNSNSSSVAFDQYSTGSAVTYTNRFHFIELPVIVKKQLDKAAHFNIYAGMSFSLLAGTNVLLYDAQSNVYMANKSQVNKMQMGVLAGFSYRLFGRNAHPVEIGPQLNYDFSNIFKKELYGNRHLFAAGINAKVFFHKK